LSLRAIIGENHLEEDVLLDRGRELELNTIIVEGEPIA
jgi:hypothetical protein